MERRAPAGSTGSKSFRSCNAAVAPKIHTARTWTTDASFDDTTPRTASSPMAASGGAKARTIAKTTASAREAPLMTRNSGFPWSIEKTGWLTP